MRTPEPVSRRDFLRRSGLLLGGALLGALAAGEACRPAVTTVTVTTPGPTATPPPSPSTSFRIVPPDNGLAYLINTDPATVDNSRLPVTPLPLTHIFGQTQEVDIAGYTLRVTGLVENPLALSYAKLAQFPAVSRTVLLICPATFADNCTWTGVPIPTLLAAAGLRPEARQVTLHAVGGVQQVLSLGDIQADGVFLALQQNGLPLQPGHGYPVRLVRRGMVGVFWLKWVHELAVG